MTPVRLEPAALRSRVKHSTTEPLRSLSVYLSGRVLDPGGGGTLIFAYIRRLGSFFWGFKILNINIFGGFQQNKYFLRV